MTTLLLSAAGSAIGGALAGPVGALAGRLGGAVAGAQIDQALFGATGSPRRVEGPRLSDLNVQASSEGTAIPAVFGRARITGQVIWATRFEEVVTDERQTSGGAGRKGGGASRSQSSTITTTYSYFGNVAVGLCEGPVSFLGRIWVDGKPLDQEGITLRFYTGSETQDPDPLIQAKQGTRDVPAFRGLCYVVFERLPLAAFGNRLPQFAFELVRPIGRLEESLTAVNIIPGAGEFIYHTRPVRRRLGLGASASENRHTGHVGTDFVASMSELQALAPNLQHAALIVGWFGDDLRCGKCQIMPGVDIAAKDTMGDVWRVGATNRANAHLVSSVDGRAAYGGTPSDASLQTALRHLKSLGLRVTLSPFLFMDVPTTNSRPDPWTGAASQPAYPWRGRITSDPAPGRVGSVDQTSLAAQQVAAFFGTASAGDFTLSGGDIIYTGPPEWSYRRMVLHNAYLAKSSGAVDVFLIGSELVGITRLRSSQTIFPAVDSLVALANDVRGILGPTVKISYAADWTEYGAYVPSDNSGDVFFPLDRLWADPTVDFVGIDFYPPLSDWRDGEHLDANLAFSPANLTYLSSRLGAGEAYDWYYADPSARARQQRTPITDGAYNKPWTYRPKDLVNWWSNAHVTRRRGIEATRSAWVPSSKPIRLTEIGIPAVDKGTNQPNLFPDPRSSESGFPFASSRARDDLNQRRGLEAILSRFDPTTAEGAIANPLSPSYGGRMLDHAATHVWCWDARPWPAYPGLSDVWGDGANWHTGHWLNGRLGSAPLDRLIPLLSEHFAGPAVSAQEADGVIQGYVIDRTMSGRAAIEPLANIFGIDIIERDQQLIAANRSKREVATVSIDGLAIDGKNDRPRLSRTQETELPQSVTLVVSDADREFRRVAVSARRVTGGSRRQSLSEIGIIAPGELAEAQAEVLLRRAWAGRETAEFSLPPSTLALEIGDVVSLTTDAGPRLMRLVSLDRDGLRKAKAQAIDPELTSPPASERLPTLAPVLVNPGQAFALVLDLPRLPGADTPYRPLLAATATPWPGGLTLWREIAGTFQSVGRIARPATVGTLKSPLLAGPVWRFDRASTVDIKLASGSLVSTTEGAVLEGANILAVNHDNGAWEIIQFTSARLVAEDTYELAGFLRGQLGTEALAQETAPVGSYVVLLDDALVPLPVTISDIGRSSNWRLAADALFFDDPMALSFSLLPSGIGLRPLSPTAIAATRRSEGILISFIRRTRGDGDSWELAEIPLSEDSEAYRVEIWDGAGIKRVLNTTTPAVLYPVGDELADFGALQSRLLLRVSQLSAIFGQGAIATASLAL